MQLVPEIIEAYVETHTSPASPLFEALAKETRETMQLHMMQVGNVEGSLLRIYIGESDRWHQHPLYEAIVLEARKQGLAGATVLRGPMGFGANSRIHTAKILRLSEDLPVLIEIADQEDKIRAFLPVLDTMVAEGLITLEKVHIVLYRHRQK